MIQLLAVTAAMALLPVLLKLKIRLEFVLLILGTLAGVIGGLPPETVLKAFIDIFGEWSNLSSLLVIIEITMLGALMTHYGLFERAETALKRCLPYPRSIIMLLPSVIGLLQVPGGAALSASFCNIMGQEMHLTPSQRSNNNVMCRHAFMLFMPSSTWIAVLFSMVEGLNGPAFMLCGFVFAALILAADYVLFIRKGVSIELPVVSGPERVKAFGEFLLMLSPVWIIVFLNLALDIPFVTAALAAIGVVFLLCDKKGFPGRLLKAFNWKFTVLIIGIYYFQNIVKSMDRLLALTASVLTGGSVLVFLVVVALAALLFGLSTGMIYVSLGVLVPLVAELAPNGGMALVANVFYVFCWSYIGYAFSPLHMCQVLSDKECGCTAGERYRAYLPMLLFIPMTVVAFYLLLYVLFF